MSTKIYNGYKFKEVPKNLSEIKEILFKFKGKVLEYYKNKYYKVFADDLCFMLDEAILFHRISYEFCTFHMPNKERGISFSSLVLDPETRENNFYGIARESFHAKSKVYKEQNRRFHQYWPYDFSCSLTIHPWEDGVFLLLFSEDQEISKILESMEEIEQYFYWNNTDAPDDISEEEWKKREDEWEIALPTGIPSKDGFSFEVTETADDVISYFIFKKELYEEYRSCILQHMNQKDKKKRVLGFAESSLYTRWKEDHKDFIEDAVKERGELNGWMHIYNTFRHSLKENKSLIEEEVEKLIPLIKQNFTVEDLRVSLEQLKKMYNIVVEKEADKGQN